MLGGDGVKQRQICTDLGATGREQGRALGVETALCGRVELQRHDQWGAKDPGRRRIRHPRVPERR